jgi:hypothetical protein
MGNDRAYQLSSERPTASHFAITRRSELGHILAQGIASRKDANRIVLRLNHWPAQSGEAPGVIARRRDPSDFNAVTKHRQRQVATHRLKA